MQIGCLSNLVSLASKYCWEMLEEKRKLLRLLIKSKVF